MSYSFVLTGKSSTLTVEFNPPIHLDDNYEYAIGLVNFETFNSIPNIEEGSNFFILDKVYIRIPPGCYEVEDIANFIKKDIGDKKTFELTANNNTLRTHLISSGHIKFEKGTIAKLLGFEYQDIPANTLAVSDHPADIFKVNAINIDCSIAEGSFVNGTPVHVIHQFFPSVPPGFKIIETPQNVIYFPVIVNVVDKITVKLVDQEGELINFQEEAVTLRLHLKRLDSRW